MGNDAAFRIDDHPPAFFISPCNAANRVSGTRPEQARFIHSHVLFEANRVKNFHPSNWHREHQIVYVKADLVKVA